MVLEEVADDADQDESDSHERAIGDERIADDEDEPDGHDNPAFGAKLKRFVFRSLPAQDDILVSAIFHNDTDTISFSVVLHESSLNFRMDYWFKGRCYNLNMSKDCLYCRSSFSARRRVQIFCSIICANRFNLNNKSQVSFSKKFTKELAEFFGVLLGDGGVEKYFVRIYLNRKADKGYSKNLIALVQKLFPEIKITCLDRPKRGTEEVQISSIDLCNYLREVGFDSKSRVIPAWITKNTDFTKAAIRGLFDTEGSIGVKYYQGKKGRNAYKQLTVTNKNKNILSFLEQGLTKFGYRPTKNSEKNIYISNRKDIQRYFFEIGTSNPKLRQKFDEGFLGVSQ